MIGVASYILNFRSLIFQPDFKFVDIPRCEVKPLYPFIEVFPLLTRLVEFEVALLLDEALAGFGIGRGFQYHHCTVKSKIRDRGS